VEREVPDPLKLLEVIVKYGPIKGKLALHKLVSTLDRSGYKFGYKFINYSFGPYSKDLEEDLRMLVRLGLVVIEEGDGGNVLIKATKKGVEVGKSLSNVRRDIIKGVGVY